MENNYGVISTTIDNMKKAQEISDKILEKGLSQCVQINKINSIYNWKTKICNNVEYKIQIKSIDDSSIISKITDVIKENHTYEVPEMIFIPIRILTEEYKSWIDSIN